MRSSRSFRRPTAAVFMVAAAAGAALVPIAGVSSAGPQPGAVQVAHSAAPNAPTSAALASPATPLTVAGSQGAGSLQAITPRAQQSGQSLDEQSVFGGGGQLDGPLWIPGVMLNAYQRAERTMAATQPGCHLPWTVLAGIGKIESGHASDGQVDDAGNAVGPILGPQLDGSPGMAAVADTDQGTLDADPGWDRAVGPMQFIPASWRVYGVGNPNNIYDSTLAAGRYLCADGADLSDPAQEAVAVFRYNHSVPYVSNVLRWAVGYQTGVVPTQLAVEPVPLVAESDGGQSAIATSVRKTSAAARPASPAVVPLDPPAAANLDAPTVANLDAPS